MEFLGKRTTVRSRYTFDPCYKFDLQFHVEAQDLEYVIAFMQRNDVTRIGHKGVEATIREQIYLHGVAWAVRQKVQRTQAAQDKCKKLYPELYGKK